MNARFKRFFSEQLLMTGILTFILCVMSHEVFMESHADVIAWDLSRTNELAGSLLVHTVTNLPTFDHVGTNQRTAPIYTFRPQGVARLNPAADTVTINASALSSNLTTVIVLWPDGTSVTNLNPTLK